MKNLGIERCEQLPGLVKHLGGYLSSYLAQQAKFEYGVFFLATLESLSCFVEENDVLISFLHYDHSFFKIIQ